MMIAEKIFCGPTDKLRIAFLGPVQMDEWHPGYTRQRRRIGLSSRIAGRETS
jgi:hypothetical protein